MKNKGKKTDVQKNSGVVNRQSERKIVVAGADGDVHFTIAAFDNLREPKKKVQMLNKEVVGGMLTEIEELTQKSLSVQKNLIELMYTKIGEETEASKHAADQVASIVLELKAMPTLSGALSKLQEYSGNQYYRNPVSGFKQALDPQISAVIGQISGEVIDLL